MFSFQNLTHPRADRLLRFNRICFGDIRLSAQAGSVPRTVGPSVLRTFYPSEPVSIFVPHFTSFAEGIGI